MIEPGKECFLSGIMQGQACRINGRLAYVLQRVCEVDLVRGFSLVAYDGGLIQQYKWDKENPIVTALGKGKLTFRVVIENGDNAVV